MKTNIPTGSGCWDLNEIPDSNWMDVSELQPISPVSEINFDYKSHTLNLYKDVNEYSSMDFASMFSAVDANSDDTEITSLVDSNVDLFDTKTLSSHPSHKDLDTPSHKDLDTPSHKDLAKARETVHKKLLIKTQLCINFDHRTGVCPYGKRCKFAHGPEDLRPRPSAEQLQHCISEQSMKIALLRKKSNDRKNARRRTQAELLKKTKQSNACEEHEC